MRHNVVCVFETALPVNGSCFIMRTFIGCLQPSAILCHKLEGYDVSDFLNLIFGLFQVRPIIEAFLKGSFAVFEGIS